MIRYLSEKLATYVSNESDSEEYEILVYGFDLWIQHVFVVVAAIVIAIPFGVVLPVIVSYVAYIPLRRYAGGTHAKHRIACIVTSIATMFVPSLIFSKTAVQIPFAGILFLSGVNLLLLIIYAPADTETRPVKNKTEQAKMKSTSIIIMLVCAAASLALHNRFVAYASMIMVNTAVVCLMTHPLLYKLYGCQKSIQRVENRSNDNCMEGK